MNLQGEKECEYWECLCVGKPWLELLADRFLLLLLLLLMPKLFVQNFLRAHSFCFLNKEQISTLLLSPQLAGVF